MRNRKFPDLIWKFRELCYAAGDVPVFYNVSEKKLGPLLDAGFSLSKIGEEATIDLTAFSLHGGARKSLRASISKAERLGCSFEVLSAEEARVIMPELRQISDQWLGEKEGSEKGFTLGSFEESYLSRFPFAVVRQNGTIIAFANLWFTGLKSEISIDLMRYRPDAPMDTMQFLFVKIMQWGAALGYHRFNRGMAPLAGLEDHPLAPVWNRIGSCVFERGETFYNFQGLRSYKDKFDPVWEPRYIATLGSLRLPQALMAVSRLSAGGWIQIFR